METKIVKKDNKLKELIKIFDGNIDLALFYVTWIKNGLKAGKAYKELHPDVEEHSAETLGSRMLKKVEQSAILEAYGLDQELYFNQLKEGVQAMKVLSARVIYTKDKPTSQANGELPPGNARTDDFIEVPDHAIRKDYHDKLGKLLGIESDKPIIQFNEMKLEITQDENKTEPVAVPSVQ